MMEADEVVRSGKEEKEEWCKPSSNKEKACTAVGHHQLHGTQEFQSQNGDISQPLSRDLEAPSSVVKSPVRPSTVQARWTGGGRS
jgi:hypothetical protein